MATTGFRKTIDTLARQRWLLVFYDVILMLLTCVMLILLHISERNAFPVNVVWGETLIFCVCILFARFCGRCYRQIWRYGGQIAYIRLIMSDICGGILYFLVEKMFFHHLSIVRQFTLGCVNLLLALMIRLVYQYMCQQCRFGSRNSKLYEKLIRTFGRVNLADDTFTQKKINLAIIGAGQVGASLAEDILLNPQASYRIRCFVDKDPNKIGRDVLGIPVLDEVALTKNVLDQMSIQEIVIAIPSMDDDKKKTLYERYHEMGFAVKIYDFPSIGEERSDRRKLREFDIEELLFRSSTNWDPGEIAPYYQGKRILITGGGGSIGSEMARQVAKMKPQRIIILDVYENGAYDLQQELRLEYGKNLDICLEITTVCDRMELEKVFRKHRPDVVIHAAAHKHVPLMESNCCEAIKNNVFGTKNVVDLCVEYEVGRFLMVSTDKAVNPTNVMGATKRMCEMIVMNASMHPGKTNFSATRFGNVLGSAGSVIPLFRRQIAKGGPVTITDKRIVRYFMTIPEASQLVLTAGAMARNGQLFVLDMGRPVRIIDLAETMISLSGLRPYEDIEIIETGLRPGEKLYEELLIDSKTIQKTENKLIFTEQATLVFDDDLEQKLESLQAALDLGDDDLARIALRRAVPTFKTPEEVNAEAEKAKEMRVS